MTPIQALEQIRRITEGNVAPVSVQREIIATVVQGLAARDANPAAPVPLTLAQQHADELRGCLNLYFDADEASANVYQEHRDRAIAVLAKTRPPQPPTLEEALGVLRGVLAGNLASHGHREQVYEGIQKLLDRVPK